MGRPLTISLFIFLLPLILKSQKPLVGIDSLAFIEKSIKKVNKNVNFTLIPGPTYQATQKLGFAVLPMIVYDLNRRDTLSPPSSTAALFYFDFYGSWMVAARQNFYWDQNKWRAILFTGYGHLMVKYFGIGRDTSVVSNSENNYVWGVNKPLTFSMACYRKIVSHLYAGLEYEYASVEWDGKDSIATAKMAGDGLNMGTTVESRLTPSFVWDSRNNIFWSTKGYYSRLTCQLANTLLLSTHDFYVFNGFVNGYHRLKKNSDRLSLAWRLYFQGSTGSVPYDQLSNYCRGDYVMGYTPGKYVNYGEINVQVEVRYDIWKILGAGAFVSTGKVFGSVWNFGQSVWLHSAGVNLYITLIPYRNIRMRLSGAVAREDWGFYIGVGQMF